MHRQYGLTLVELMLGLVISIVMSLAAAALYLATRESSRSTQERADIIETGKTALDMMGRELQKAGFYPAEFATPLDVAHAGRYYNAKASHGAPFAHGLFGCDDRRYDPATHACSTEPSNGDTLVINYFASPEFGASSNEKLTDCNSHAVSNDPDNATQLAAGLPLFVSNRFGLARALRTTNAKTSSASSLACQGNGADAAAAQPVVHGIEDLVIRYGISPGGTTQSPTQFTNAAGVDAAAPTSDGLSPWQRVTAISVCIVVRSADALHEVDKSGTARTYRNCRGGMARTAGDNAYVYQSFERVYAIRNNLK